MGTNYVLHLFMLLSLGVIGAFVALKLRFPTAEFLGPILFVGTYQVTFGSIMDKPYWLRLVVQIAVGIVLGTKLTKSFFSNFKKLIKPTLMVSSILVSGAVLLGMLLQTFTGWDLITCIIATSPGGQGEMALLSDSVGAETEKVIILQLIRNQMALVVLLPLARFYLNKKEVAER